MTSPSSAAPVPTPAPLAIAKGFVAWRFGRVWSRWHIERAAGGTTLCGQTVGPVADRHGMDCPSRKLAEFCQGCLTAYARRAP